MNDPAFCIISHRATQLFVNINLILKYEPTFEKNENRRFHAHRAAGRDRHHRHFGGYAVAGAGESQGQGTENQMCE